MLMITNASYSNSSLLLLNKLNFPEGKQLKIIIIDREPVKKEMFLDFVRLNKLKIPKGFTIKREELYDR